MAIQEKLTNPDRITITVFLVLLALPAQYFLFIILFPDGGFEMVRSTLNTLTEMVLFPANIFLGSVASIFSSTQLVVNGRLPGGIGLVVYMAYFYLIGVVISTFSDFTVKRTANKA